MTVYSNKEVLYGKIEYRRQKVPYGSFFLSDGIDVSPDDEIKIIGNYKGSTSTRTIVSGINGVTAVGTDNFTSSGVTFSTSGIVAGDMLIIKGSGSDAGCYIVDTVDSETQLSLDDHAGVPVSFSGNTALEYEVGLIIFRGIIDKTDFEANQTIEVFSATEEITQERPTGSYYGYSEVIVGEMISQSSLGNTNINYTESTLTIRPDGESANNEDWDDPNGNNNDIMYDDINEESPDGSYIENYNAPADEIYFTFTGNTLNTDYHYRIYNARVRIRARYGASQHSIFQNIYLDFHDSFGWKYDRDMAKMPLRWIGGSANWEWFEWDITVICSEDEIDDFQIYVRESGMANDELNIDTIEMVVYYRYYDDFIDVGSYKHSLVCSGEKTIADYADLYAIDEQMTWYLDTSLYFYFRNADGDSGEDFAKTNYMKNIIGDRNNKTYSRVILFGGYTSGVQMTSSTGSGFPLWKDTYSTINDQTQLDNLASAILTEQSANQYVIQIYREDSTDGLYQVGETVTLPADPNQIKFSDSDRLIPAGQYILNKIDYILNDGQYLILDIEIIDGLIFSNPRQDNTTGSNAENIANEATVQISQVGGGESVGEANTGQNVGSDGVGVYYSKSGVALQFRNIAPASNKVTVVENGNDIDIDVNEGELDKYTQAEVDAALHAEVHTHDGQTLQLDGISSDGGAFNIITSQNINFKPYADADDFIIFSNIDGVPIILFSNVDGRIVNVLDPTDAQDVATKAYHDANKYTNAEVEAVITAELVDGQSIDNAIDALIGATDHVNAAGAVAAVAAADDYLKLVGDTMGGAINMNSNNITGVNTIVTLGVANYDKFRVWTNPAYTIGLMDAMTYGGLNNYAMTFTVYHTVDRGWVWRDDDDAKNDGAMSLTTAGVLTVKGASTFQSSLQVDGNITTGGTVDGQDVAAMAADLANQCTTAEAHAFVEANALTLTADVTFNAGQLFDGKDVSGLCTTAEAITAVSGALAGDVTGTVGATVVGNDSHDHTEAHITDLDHDAVKILTKEFTEGGGDLANGDIAVYRVATGKWELEPIPAPGGGISEADAFALLGIGIANKRWKNCIIEGASNHDELNVADAYRNIGSGDMYLSFGIPLDYIIGTKNLVITRFKIGIASADVVNKVTRIRMYGWSDHDSGAVLATEDADRTAPGEYITDHADVTLGGNQERVNFLVETVCSTANLLSISYLKVEYYYA